MASRKITKGYNSPFFQVTRQELGFPEQIARLPVPEDLVLRLA